MKEILSNVKNKITSSAGWSVEPEGRSSFLYKEADTKIVIGGELLRSFIRGPYFSLFMDQVYLYPDMVIIELPDDEKRRIGERIRKAYKKFGTRIVVYY